MKSKFTLWSVVLFLAGFIFIGCETMNERKTHLIFRQEFIKL